MAESREAGAGVSESSRGRPVRLFVSYASEDDAHRIELEKHLRLLQREGLVHVWSDRMLLPGGSWGDEIDEQLEGADIVLLLVSVDFLASDYCWEVEMRRALERHGLGEARVIPIIVDDCDWKSAPFAELQALPERARPVTLWDNRATAWKSVAEGIRRVAQGIASRAAPARDRAGPDPQLYLEAVRDSHSHVEIRGMGAQVSERMPLRTVYTRLHAVAPRDELPSPGTRPSKGKGAELGPDGLRGASERELRDLLPGHPHAALIGDPGSGKTTFLSYVAQCLARAGLGEAEALEGIGLSGQAPLPILVRLERLARFLTQNPDQGLQEDAPEHLYRYLEQLIAGFPYGLPDDYLRRRVSRGGCFLLLDGLDEVPGAALRERLVRLIEKVIVAGKAAGNRHLVTCRTRAYQGRVQLAGDLSTFRLAPLGRAQVEQFADGWSRALYRVDGKSPEPARLSQAEDYRAELLRAIDANPSGATFSQSPLMLTVLAVVHWNRKKLPEQRAELYRSAVDYLLDSRSELSPHPEALRRECLQAVAIRMLEDPEGVQRSLGRIEAAQAVEEMLGASRSEALDFIEAEELYSGLLVSRSQGEVEFWHLTFQEYLAALELSQDGGWERIRGHLGDDRWSEVILLLAGCLRQGGLRGARRLIERVLGAAEGAAERARTVGLVGRMLRDIRAYGGEPERGTEYDRMLAETLAIFEPGGEEVDEPTRIEVGEALGQAGDPRLAEAERNRIAIRGGSFWMGAQSSDPQGPGFDPEAHEGESPVHRAQVSDFIIGRYPITVDEFRIFLEAGAEGYMDPRRWSPQGWAWREKAGSEAPEEWTEQLRHRNRPATSVSWYEADAFCRWAGGRLPTEAEWEWVARGPQARRYPWGDEQPTERHACFDMRVEHPVPVGIYPLGGAVESAVRDLAGNVWEWCGDWYGPYRDRELTDPAGPSSGEFRVLRGGSCYYNPHTLRAAYRSNFHPENRVDDVGFRVVWSSAGGQD